MTDIRNTYREEPGLTLQDLSGKSYWKTMLQGLLPAGELDEFLCLQAKTCICLTGEPGVGKRTLARAFAGSVRPYGYTFLHVADSMLCSFSQEDRIGLLREVFQDAVRTPCVMMLEPQGNTGFWRAVAGFLPVVPSEAALIVFLIEDEPESICPQGLPDLLVFSVGAPDQEAREAFFADDANRLMRGTDSRGEKTPSYEFLACETEGLTYTELKQVIRMIRLQLKKRALTEFGGSIEGVLDEYRAGRFCYTKEMFRDAVQKIRDAKEQRLQTKTAAAVVMPQTAAQVQMPEQAGLSFESGFSAEDPEEEAALKKVMSGLRLPPDPRKKQDAVF